MPFEAKLAVFFVVSHVLCVVIGYAVGRMGPPEKPGTE